MDGDRVYINDAGFGGDGNVSENIMRIHEIATENEF